MSASPQAPIAGDPQMAFVNGVQLAQKPTLAEITSTSFFYDWTARRLYIATDPNGKTVELAVRPVAMVLGGSNTNGNTLRGIGFRRLPHPRRVRPPPAPHASGVPPPPP